MLVLCACLPDDPAWKPRFDLAPDKEASVIESSTTDTGGDVEASDGGDAGDADMGPSLRSESPPVVVRGRIAGVAVFPVEALVRITKDEDAGTATATFTLTESSGSCATPPAPRACGASVLTFRATTPATDAGVLATGTHPIATIGFSTSDSACMVTSYALTISPGATVTVVRTDGGSTPSDAGDDAEADAAPASPGTVTGTFAFEIAEGGRISGRFVAEVCSQP